MNSSRLAGVGTCPHRDRGLVEASGRELLNRELNSEIHRAITELPETYRAVVLLRDMEELSTEETAQILDVSTDVVKTRLHRGRLAIRQKLDAYLRAATRSVRE